MLKDSGYESYDYKKWLTLRYIYLADLKRQYKALWCEYCGQYLILINKQPNMTNKVATVDHFVPISKGGAIYDPKNFAVSCWPCNKKFDNNLKRKGRRKYPYITETLLKLPLLNGGLSYGSFLFTEKQRQNTGCIHIQPTNQNNLPRLYEVLS